MEVKCVPHILRESLYCGFRPCHSLFIRGWLIFLPGRVDISHSNAGGAVGGRPPAVVSAAPPSTGLMRTAYTPGGYHPHAKDLLFYFVSYMKVGLFISFTGCLGLLAGVCRFWQMFAGFGGPLLVPTCKARLRLFWAGVRL